MIKAVIEMKDYEDLIELELYDEHAPNTVANFVKLIKEGYYDGLTFHRVIDGFVSQGGCPNGTGTGGPGYTIDCEVKDNPLIHEPGALSMAHAGPNTGGSQFFICHDYFSHLDGVHTVFGKAITGMNVVLNMKNGDIINKITVKEG